MHLYIYCICSYIRRLHSRLPTRMAPCAWCRGETRTFVCLGCVKALLHARTVVGLEASGSSELMPSFMELDSQAREEALRYFEDRLRTCAVCYKEAFKMQKCERCKSTHYCSKSCQSKDWPIHKLSCRPNGREEALRYSDGRLRTCAVCNKEDFKMQRCKRCKST